MQFHQPRTELCDVQNTRLADFKPEHEIHPLDVMTMLSEVILSLLVIAQKNRTCMEARHTHTPFKYPRIHGVMVAVSHLDGACVLKHIPRLVRRCQELRAKR
jgi:hypothetical protein